MNNAAFHTGDGNLISTRSEEAIPEDEPVFILRGRDIKALSTIRSHQSQFSPTTETWKNMQRILESFSKFRKTNPYKMTEPEDLY